MARLSLIVAARAGSDPARFMQALSREAGFGSPDVAVHIAHGGSWRGCAIAAGVQLHACPAPTSAFHLWATGITRSSSDYIAMLDIEMPPETGWLSRVWQEIARDTPAFYGPIDPGWDWRDRRITGYLAEYVQFGRTLPVSFLEVPGTNLVAKRALFGSRAVLDAEGFIKTSLLQRFGLAEGRRVPCFDDMAVRYYKGFALRSYLATRFLQGRTFAARRHLVPAQPNRLACLAFTPLLPALRLWRIHRAARPIPDLAQAVWRHFPALTLSEMAWSVGELFGYASPVSAPQP